MLPMNRNRAAAFDTLVDLSRDLDRLVGTPWTERANGMQGIMPAEIIETDEEIRFDIELPGVRGEDIEVTLENSILSIAAEKKMERAEGAKDEDYRLFERRYGKFQRSFSVPPTVRGDSVDARYDNGVLSVRLPKAEDAKPRRIQVQAGPSTRSIEEGSRQA